MTDPATWVAAGRELAQAATPGPWLAETPHDSGYTYVLSRVTGLEVAVDFEAADAEWVADARTRLPVALDAIAAVLALHQPTSFVGVQCDEHTCTGTDDHPCEEADPYATHELPSCGECSAVTDDGDPGQYAWPCATVRAITEAIERGRA